MTPRQWKLYNLLKGEPNKWFTQKEICEEIEGYTYVERNNDRCPMIREDKIAINRSIEVDHLIVMDKYRFKIADEFEARKEYYKHWKRMKNQIAELQAFEKKAKRDGQGKILSNQGNVIDENSKAKKFYDTFGNE